MNKIGDWDFDEIIKKIESSSLPVKVGDLAQKEFKKNFETESFFGTAWLPTQKKSSNPTLTESGALRKSIKVIQADWTKIEIATVGNKVNDYSYKHNYGVGVPKRQFMGESEVLDSKIEKLIEKELDKILKK